MGTLDEERPGPLQLGARYKASRMKQIERTLARLNTASYEVISERNTAKAALELEKAAYWMAHLASDIAAHSRINPKEYQS